MAYRYARHRFVSNPELMKLKLSKCYGSIRVNIL